MCGLPTGDTSRPELDQTTVFTPRARDETPNDQQTQRFVTELQTEPPSSRVRDLVARKPPVEPDESTRSGFMAVLSDDDVGAASAERTESLQATAASPGDDSAAAHRQDLNQLDDPQPGREAKAEKKTRYKLWDLPQSLHCPIIGTCLDVDELRRLARKVRCRNEAPMSDYDVHVSFVSMAGGKNGLSLAAQKTLAKKYAADVERFAKAKTTAQLAVLWNDALARGAVPGGFWATLTHPKCDEPLRTRAFQEVHMLSHQIGAGQRADLKRLAQTQSKLAHLKHDYETQQRRSRQQLEDREQRIRELESALRERDEERHRMLAREQDLRRQLATLQASATHEYVSIVEQKARRFERQLRLTERDRDRWHDACEVAERRAASLAADLQSKVAECAALEQRIAPSQAACHGCAGDNCADCPDLHGRLILCVGGRNQLIDQYRALVARCNGRFDHHDGGVEDNRQRLEGMLSSADVVLCATDCVSHDAYFRLKRFCKRHRKPHVFLRSSGVSTFARALENIAG